MLELLRLLDKVMVDEIQTEERKYLLFNTNKILNTCLDLLGIEII